MAVILGHCEIARFQPDDGIIVISATILGP